MATVNLNKHIWEGWTVKHFIDDLAPMLEMVMNNQSHIKKLTTKAELKDYCKNYQPHYKKHIPDVVNHFAQKYNLK